MSKALGDWYARNVASAHRNEVGRKVLSATRDTPLEEPIRHLMALRESLANGELGSIDRHGGQVLEATIHLLINAMAKGG